MCSSCKRTSPTRYLSGDSWLCGDCYSRPSPSGFPYFKEMGVENPTDPEGSTAHVRDIKQRRWHPEEKRMFYYEPPKTYFFPKG